METKSNNLEESMQNEQERIEESLSKAVQKGKKKKTAKQEAWEWIVSLAVALLVVFVIRTFLFQIIKVDGESMFPTLQNGERLFVTVYDAKLGNIHRDDVVICRYPGRGNVDFVKRIVAAPGDTVKRVGNVTHVVCGDSGEDIVLDAANQNSRYYAGNDYEYTLKEGEFFAVGDNRVNSHDSRIWDGASVWDGESATTRADYVGPVTSDMIVGRVREVIWPIKNIRSVGAYEAEE